MYTCVTIDTKKKTSEQLAFRKKEAGLSGMILVGTSKTRTEMK